MILFLKNGRISARKAHETALFAVQKHHNADREGHGSWVPDKNESSQHSITAPTPSLQCSDAGSRLRGSLLVHADLGFRRRL